MDDPNSPLGYGPNEEQYFVPNNYNLMFDNSIPSDYPYFDQLPKEDKELFQRGWEMLDAKGLADDGYDKISKFITGGHGLLELDVKGLSNAMGRGLTESDLKAIGAYAAGHRYDMRLGFDPESKQIVAENQKFGREFAQKRDSIISEKKREKAEREREQAREASIKAKEQSIKEKGQKVGANINKAEAKADSLGDKLNKKFLKDGSIRKGQEANVKQLREKLDAAKEKMVKSIPERDMKKIMEVIPDHMRYLVGKDNLLTKQVLTEPQYWEIEDYERGRGDSGYRNLGEVIKEAKNDDDRSQNKSVTVSVGGKEYEVTMSSYSNKIHYDPKQFATYDEIVISPKGSYRELRFGTAGIEGG